MARLQDQNFEHEHVIERRAPALQAVGARHRPRQVGPEHFEVNDPVQPLKIIALRREIPQPFLNVEKSALTPHRPLPNRRPRESHSR